MNIDIFKAENIESISIVKKQNGLFDMDMKFKSTDDVGKIENVNATMNSHMNYILNMMSGIKMVYEQKIINDK